MKRMHSIAAVALCGLSLALLSVPAAHAAGQGQPVYQAQAGSNPDVVVWTDNSQGTTLNNQAAQSIQRQFAGSQWSFLDNNQVMITQNGQPVAGAFYVASQDGSSMTIHYRGKSGTIDGTVLRNSDDPSQGVAFLYVEQVASDGKSAAGIQIITDLSFGGSSGTGSGGLGGF